MSTRERWIVYPLLFLTLGIALRDKYVPPKHFQAGEITANRLHCGQLEVAQLHVGQIACRELLVSGPNGRPVVVATTNPLNQSGVVETFSASGSPLVRFQSTEGGGLVTAVGQGNQVVAMGFLDQNFGVFAQLPELGLTIPLTQSLVQEAKGGAASSKKPKRPVSPSPTPPTKKTAGK